MATYAQNLITARDNFAAELATQSANPKPSYSLDGESYSWPDYYRFLREQIKDLNEQIANADGGFEVRSQGVS